MSARPHPQPQRSPRQRWTQRLVQWGLAVGLPAIVALPAAAAERLYVNYGLLEFSIPIAELEVYAQDGTLGDELGAYARYLSDRDLEQLRELLVTPVEISPAAIWRFLNSPQGETLLERIGELVQTQSYQSGFYAIRSALVTAAAEEEGLTLLNILQEFPTPGIRINSSRALALFEKLVDVERKTDRAIAAIATQADAERSAGINGAGDLPDLETPGEIEYRRETFSLTDRRRDREFPVALYLPELPTGQKAPIVVISHGLGSDLATFAYLAEHLASYGFGVAVLEHPGSNAQQLQQLLSGLASEVSPVRELIDRPYDVQYLLDELERRFSSRLEMRSVGILGQSYGGYTSLALAGARFNYDTLRATCESLEGELNLSLILQCQALSLPPVNYQLHDERIAAAIAINPFASRIFGMEGTSAIEIPVAIVSGSADTITPAVFEQVQPFTWLASREKYLALLEGGTHFSTLAETKSSIELPSDAIGPDPAIARAYLQVLTTAFFSVHLSDRAEYRPYLSADYAAILSRPLLPLELVTSLDASDLIEPGTEDEES